MINPRRKRGRFGSSKSDWRTYVAAGFIIAVVSLTYERLCPTQYRIPQPYPEPAFISLSLVVLGIAAFREAWSEWKFWVSLVIASALQVWVSGQLILHGWTGHGRRGKGFQFVGILAWGLSYGLLFLAQRGIEHFRKKNDGGPL